MPSAKDFYNRLGDIDDKLNNLQCICNQLQTVNNNLTTIHVDLGNIAATLGAIDTTMQWGLAQLITIGNYANQALYQNDQQNDTMICILEHIAKDVCAQLNEAHTQTGLQTTIKDKVVALADLYAAAHPADALALERLEAIRKQCEECCPPKPVPPVCVYEPCPAPGKIDGPPKVAPTQPTQPLA